MSNGGDVGETSKVDVENDDNTPKQKKKRVLVIFRFSPVGGGALPATEKEIISISRLYEGIGAEVRKHLSGTPKKLHESLTPDVTDLHIASHMDDKTLGDDSILFVDDGGTKSVIPAKEVVKLIAMRKDTLELVVLNGCRSGKNAAALAQKGVRCVVGWKTNVNDTAAKLFADGWYAAWVQGESPSKAFESAKRRIMTRTFNPPLNLGREVNQWILEPKTLELFCRTPAGVPVFYARKTCSDRKCEPPRDLVGRSFVDGLRHDDVAAVAEMLVGGDVGARRKVGLHGVNGLGGLGKSTLAQQLCWHVPDIRSVFFNGGMFWLTASEDTSVLAELRKMVYDLYGLHSPGDDIEHVLKKCDSERNAYGVVDYFLKESWPAIDRAPVLIVLDDVWDAKKVESLVPLDALPKGSAVLMTYRDRRVGTNARVTSQYALSVLSEDASLKLLRDACGKKAPREAALGVAKRLGYHPMALKIAARDVLSRDEDGDASCDATKSTVWQDYFKDLDAHVEDLTLDDMEKIDDNEERRRHTSVFCSIALSLRRLRGKGRRRGRHGAFNPEVLRKKYRQLAIFGEDAAIPPMALKRVWEFTKASETEACAGVFVQAGLLEKQVNGAEGEYVSYRMHDLCRDYVRWRVEKEKGEGGVRAMQRSFVEWLARQKTWRGVLTADGDDRSRRVRAMEWERTFEVAVRMEVVSRSNAEPNTESAKVVYEYSEVLEHFGQLVEAKSMAEKALEMFYVIYGTNTAHPAIAAALNNLGRVLLALDDFEEAKAKFEACLEMDFAISKRARAETGTNDYIFTSSISTSLQNLARVLHDLGDLEKAKRLYETSLKVLYATHGADKAHPSIAITLGNLASLLRSMGDLEEAKATFEACLKMQYVTNGIDKAHPHTATTLSKFGTLLQDMGDLEEAKAKYQACLKMCYAIYGSDKAHPHIADLLFKLGNVLEDLGDLEEARATFEACLNMYYAIYETDTGHADITMCMASLEFSECWAV